MSTTGDGQVRGATRPKGSWFYRLGGFSYRRRWWVIGAWLLLFVASVPLLGKLADRLSQGGFEVPGSQSFNVAEAIQTDFTGQFEIFDLLVMDSESLTAEDPAFRSAFENVRDALLDAPGVAAVSDPYATPERYISQDGRTLTAEVGLSATQDEALRQADELNTVVAEVSSGTEVRALLTGDAPFYAAFSETTTHDLERAERVALPISLLILILAFGSLVAAGLPIALALLSLAITFGIVSLIAATTTVSIFTQNIASMIGIGVGIDYSLFILTRFREELRPGRAESEAVAAAIATSGKAVFVSALTVVVALSGILLVDIAAIRSMGFGAMIAVAMAGAAALTLLPALLALLGRRVDKLSIRRRRVSQAGGGWWHRWAMAVMRRPWLALLGSLAVVALLAFPAAHLRLGSSGPDILPADAGPRVAAEITADAFGEGQIAPVQVVVTDPRGVTADGFDDLYEMTGTIAQDPEVVRVLSIAGLVPEATAAQAKAFVNSPISSEVVDPLVARQGTRTLVNVVTRHGAQSDESDAFVERLRVKLPQILPSGVTADVGGSPGLNVDINSQMQSKIPPVVTLVLVLSFILLLLFFRSLLLPLKAILMNAASVLAAYGLLVFVFQDGHFEGLLGFVSPGHIESFVPLFLFCILFGLSMDYEVFLLARIREEYLRTGDNTEAVGWGLEHTGRIITSAAAVMVTVFGAFAFASLIPIKTMGFGLAVAVLLDATLIRVILVPAAMRLMGKWNWWLPGWLDRILPKVSVEGATEPGPETEREVRAGV
ncbi:MAG TPA: MMPL family transporter [Actinomycetota bacterium]|nr:MMPL family transporter [Actinomycetota bacterium]